MKAEEKLARQRLSVKVYAQMCVGIYSSLGSAFLHTSKEPEAAATLKRGSLSPTSFTGWRARGAGSSPSRLPQEPL